MGPGHAAPNQVQCRHRASRVEETETMPTSGPQLQWVMIGLVTGAEVFGHLPRAAAGRFVEFMNSDLGDVLAIGRASTEDIEHGSEVPEIVLWLRHVTYVQPWSAEASVQ